MTLVLSAVQRVVDDFHAALCRVYISSGTTDKAVPNMSVSVAPGYIENTASAISNHWAGSLADHAGSLALVTSRFDIPSSLASSVSSGVTTAAGKTKL